MGRLSTRGCCRPSCPPARGPERVNNERAWQLFRCWDKPFLTLFGNRDPVTRGGHRIWHKLVPGARGQPHAVTRGAGHFLQEDKGVEVAHWWPTRSSRSCRPRQWQTLEQRPDLYLSG